jgi:3-deoxy-7-phosphoheptulonate synthase
MLVFMKIDSSPDQVAAISCRADELGLRAARVQDSETSMVVIDGDNASDAASWVRQMPGVDRVLTIAENERPVTNNLRIAGIRPLVPPEILQEELPLPAASARVVFRTRQETSAILHGKNDRLLVVVGPCSIHAAEAALEYSRRLADLASGMSNDLLIVMRVYFEKPRTTVGWKGLINDPNLDGSFAVNHGLRIARQLLLDVIAQDLPAGCEFLDPITPQFIADLVTWGAIGARTTESQVHRNLTSGLSMPVGFKNGTSGDIQIALDAMKAAAYPHQFMSVTEQGVAAIVVTRGNRDTHLILRGGESGPNYDPEHVRRALAGLTKSGAEPRLMIDASHGNSGKDYRRQPDVVDSVASQIAGGETGIVGVMLESFLADGRQELTDRAALTYGQSITDSCMGWEMTVPVLQRLADAVRARRTAN